MLSRNAKWQSSIDTSRQRARPPDKPPHESQLKPLDDAVAAGRWCQQPSSSPPGSHWAAICHHSTHLKEAGNEEHRSTRQRACRASWAPARCTTSPPANQEYCKNSKEPSTRPCSVYLDPLSIRFAFLKVFESIFSDPSESIKFTFFLYFVAFAFWLPNGPL